MKRSSAAFLPRPAVAAAALLPDRGLDLRAFLIALLLLVGLVLLA